MRLKRSLAAVTVAGLMALAACGGGSDDEGDGGSSTVDSDNTNAGTAGSGKDPKAEGPVEIDGATEGGTVTVMSTTGTTTMDPTEAYVTAATSVLSGLMTRSLTQFKYVDGDMVLVPDLATDLGTPNKDFTEWKFTIRDGIKWEDGSDVTMDDVVFGIERSFGAFGEGTFPTGASYTKEYFLNGDTFRGPYLDKGKSCECTEVDGQTITLKMAKPFPDLPYWGSFPAMGPIPVAQKDKDPTEYQLHPVSTGPYKLDGNINPGHGFTLVRNENWDAASDPARTAYPDKYVIKADYGDPNVPEKQILNNSGDGEFGILNQNVTAANLQAGDEAGQLVTGPTPCTAQVYINMRDPKWSKDINVRKALALAWPYQEAWLARGVTVGVTRIPGTTIMPPGTPGRVEYDALGNKGMNTETDAAKKLLEDAGAVGQTVSFGYTTEDPLRVDEKNAIVKGLKAAGFEPKPIAFATDDEWIEKTQDANWKPDIKTRLAWCADWPSGSSWFPPVYGTGSNQNYSYLADKELDAQMDDIQTKPLEDQPGLWGEMDKQIGTDILPTFNIGFIGNAFIHGSAVQGANNDQVLAQPTFKTVWIKQ